MLCELGKLEKQHYRKKRLLKTSTTIQWRVLRQEGGLLCIRNSWRQMLIKKICHQHLTQTNFY